MSELNDQQTNQLLFELADNMRSQWDFDIVASALIEWGIINADEGAKAPAIWQEAHL
jgi:hypothetical protein